MNPFHNQGGDRYGLTRGILQIVWSLLLIEDYPNYIQIYSDLQEPNLQFVQT